MKEIEASKIKGTVAKLCVDACYVLPDDVLNALKKAEKEEESPVGKETLRQLVENARIAVEEKLPLCQDCGVAVIFLEVGQDAHIVGGDLYKAISDGVKKGYEEGYLRKSVDAHPFAERENTGDNTPPVIHTTIVPGDKLKISVLPKGAGSENMCRLFMLVPGDGREGVIKTVVKAVEEAGGKPCPPLILGVGVGGMADNVMVIARHSLLRKLGEPGKDPDDAALEKEILKRVNDLGIGPLGFGGRVTALAVHVESSPTHIACMPVAVAFQCHSARHKEAVL
jgi:fumarate hydratase subunit alpha